MSTRENALQSWLSTYLHTNDYAMSLLAGDASHRRYYRVHCADQSWVVMDAPPEVERIDSFMAVANLLLNHQVQVPLIEAYDDQQGFIIMADLGDGLLQDALDTNSATPLYQRAIDILLTIQTIPTETSSLPHYGMEKLLQGLQLFTDWFCQRYLSLTLSQQEHTIINECLIDLATNVSQQETCVTHRDYHSRNIMVLNQHPMRLGVIDFQDAAIGPYPYDLVSLLKDCYIDWPLEQQHQWCDYYFQRAQFNQNKRFEEFMLDFHLCGLQRHLRVLGTFSRLYLRDKKNRYLTDMPRIIHYIKQALSQTGQYPDLERFFHDKVRLP